MPRAYSRPSDVQNKPSTTYSRGFSLFSQKSSYLFRLFTFNERDEFPMRLNFNLKFLKNTNACRARFKKYSRFNQICLFSFRFIAWFYKVKRFWEEKNLLQHRSSSVIRKYSEGCSPISISMLLLLGNLTPNSRRTNKQNSILALLLIV